MMLMDVVFQMQMYQTTVLLKCVDIIHRAYNYFPRFSIMNDYASVYVL